MEKNKNYYPGNIGEKETIFGGLVIRDAVIVSAISVFTIITVILFIYNTNIFTSILTGGTILFALFVYVFLNNDRKVMMLLMMKIRFYKRNKEYLKERRR